MNLLISLGVAFAIYIIYAIPRGVLMRKAGEPLWKGWIPLYNLYMMYKKCWGWGWFFIAFLLLLIPGLLALGNGAVYSDLQTPIIITDAILYAVYYIVQIVYCYKISKAFNHGVPLTIGLIFLHPIFLYVLAFSKKSYYVRNA